MGCKMTHALLISHKTDQHELSPNNISIIKGNGYES